MTIWDIWLKRGIVARVLWPVSIFFRVVIFLRRFCYRIGLAKSDRLRVPVIVVGNLFIGGTGKTPFTIWLIEALRAIGHHPGVISRGYGSAVADVREVTMNSSAREAGDEPVLIVRRTGCPLFIGKDRIAAARALLRLHPDVDMIVSDDGLQHYRLQRDLEIVLSDRRGIGNGWLLPAGPLRESPNRRRDFDIVNIGSSLETPTALSQDTIVMRLCTTSMELLGDRQRKMTLKDLASRNPAPSITAAAGIGDPARFFTTLHIAGVVFMPMPLADHYDFTEQTFADCGTEFILITEKDAVKCCEIAALANDARIWVVPVSAKIAAPLVDYIVEKIRGHETA